MAIPARTEPTLRPRETIRIMYVLRDRTMQKKLTRQGNSAALVIDKPILELLALKAGSRVEIVTDGRSLLVRPLRALSPRRRAAFARALAETNRAWGTTLRRLAGR